MASDKNALSGSTTMLVLKLLEEKDMYGYQIIEELARRSEDAFRLKTGTLYPILHGLEQSGAVTSYDCPADGGRVRRYYRLTAKGRGMLEQRRSEWTAYTKAVGRVLDGGAGYAFA